MKLTVLVMVLLLTSSLHADDSGGSDSDQDQSLNTQVEMQDARALIEALEYRSAIRALNNVVQQDHRNADAWNLLGYSYRNLGKMKKARKAYRKALKYNPEHKGALEYQGELFVEMNELDKARANRAKLAVLCPEGCEELDDLDAALLRSE